MTRPSIAISRPIMPPAADPLPVRHERMLMCDTCGTWTKHSLTKSGAAYICGCGSKNDYLINAGPAMWAIR